MSTPVTVRLCDVMPERVEWLWPGRLPAGKLVLLDGDPGVGKSTIAVNLAAHLTIGRVWPDGAPCPAGDVLILSAEDGLADTVRPRLDAAKGEPSRVHALTDIEYPCEDGINRTRPVTLADVDAIEKAVRDTGAIFVIVDVLMAYLPGRVDSHKDQDVRGVLSAVKDVAERTGATFLLLRHLNKASGGSPLYRGGGSIGIIGAARTAMLAAPDPDDESRHVLAITKNNLAAKPPALAYRLVDSGDGGCASVQWEGATAHTADQLLARRDDEVGEERSERDEAADWLVAYLTECGGEAAYQDVIKAGRAQGFAERTLKRARQKAAVTSDRRGFGSGAVWVLPLGPQSAHSGRSGQDSEAGTDGPNGPEWESWTPPAEAPSPTRTGVDSALDPMMGLINAAASSCRPESAA